MKGASYLKKWSNKMKMLKQLAIVALVCYGVSALAMEPGASAALSAEMQSRNVQSVDALIESIKQDVMQAGNLIEARKVNEALVQITKIRTSISILLNAHEMLNDMQISELNTMLQTIALMISSLQQISPRPS